MSPTDGKPMVETLRGYKSQDAELMIYKVIGGRRIEESEARELAAKGEVGPLDGFVSAKSGNRYPAKLKIGKDEKTGKPKVEIDLGNKVDVTTLEPFWTDPKTGAELCEGGNGFILRERDGDTWKEALKLGKRICQKEITRENAIELVTNGKTNLITAFISRFGKPFDAFLVRQGAKTVFEFPPRQPKEGGAGKGPRKAKEAPDLSKAVVLGTSKPHGDAELVQTDDLFVVHKPGAEGKPRVVFKLNTLLCGRKIKADEVKTLLEEGRTELIEDFLSKRGTKFSAYLVLSKNKAKADFEFPPR